MRWNLLMRSFEIILTGQRMVRRLATVQKHKRFLGKSEEGIFGTKRPKRSEGHTEEGRLISNHTRSSSIILMKIKLESFLRVRLVRRLNGTGRDGTKRRFMLCLVRVGRNGLDFVLND